MNDSGSDDAVAPVSAATVRRAWRIASRIVSSRPWLEVSWMVAAGHPDHLVVHDSWLGPALHFDDDEGPLWESRSSPDEELEWEEVEDLDVAHSRVDWAAHWGAAAAAGALTERAAIYTLIAHLLDVDDGQRWEARPAKLLHHNDDSAQGPTSAFTLMKDFNALETAVNWYVSQITGPSWGPGAVWHEPLWVITRDGEPRLVLDEGGTVHLTCGSLAEVMSVMAAATDKGGIEEPWSIDLMDALPRVGDDFSELAALLRSGPGHTLQVVKPNRSTSTPPQHPNGDPSVRRGREPRGHRSPVPQHMHRRPPFQHRTPQVAVTDTPRSEARRLPQHDRHSRAHRRD